jgi:hypothetical protein
MTFASFFQKSHDSERSCANSSKASWSSLVKPLSLAQSMSMIATTYPTRQHVSSGVILLIQALCFDLRLCNTKRVYVPFHPAQQERQSHSLTFRHMQCDPEISPHPELAASSALLPPCRILLSQMRSSGMRPGLGRGLVEAAKGLWAM